MKTIQKRVTFNTKEGELSITLCWSVVVLLFVVTCSETAQMEREWEAKEERQYTTTLAAKHNGV